MGGFATIRVGGSPMRVYVAKPDEVGPYPAVVAMCHGSGLDDFTADVCEKLAQAGFVAAAPDVFHRFPEVTDPAVKRERIRDIEIADDLQACVDLLCDRYGARADAIGIIGHCMGGRMSFLGAEVNRAIRACVTYYGGNMFKSWGDGPTPYSMLDRITCPVLGFFGMDDTNPSPADADAIEVALKKAGVRYTFHRYAGAGHAFQNFMRSEAYRPDATRASWPLTVEFLSATLM